MGFQRKWGCVSKNKCNGNKCSKLPSLSKFSWALISEYTLNHFKMLIDITLYMASWSLHFYEKKASFSHKQEARLCARICSNQLKWHYDQSVIVIVVSKYFTAAYEFASKNVNRKCQEIQSIRGKMELIVVFDQFRMG